MKTGRFFIFSLLSVFLTGCAYFNTFYNARKYFQDAYKATEKNKTNDLAGDERSNYQKSVEKSLLLLEDFPDSKWADDALLLLGKSYFYLRDYTASERRLDELIAGFPSSEFVNEARFWLAKNKVATQRFQEAENDLIRLTSQSISKKQKGEIIFYQARFYESKKDFAKAIETYQQVLKTDEKTWGARVWFAIGGAYDSLGIFDRSAEAFRQVLRFSPDPEMEFDAQFRFARAEKDLGQFDEAVRILEKLQRDEKNKAKIPALRLEVADCLTRKGDASGAMLTYQDVIQSNPNTDASAEAHYRLGELFETGRKDYGKALDHFTEVRKQSSRSIFADSADIKGRDILRLKALNQVIGMALRGEKGDAVEVGSMAQEDTLTSAREDSIQQKRGSSPSDSSGIRDRDSRRTDALDREGRETSQSTDSLAQRKAKRAIAENPELKSFNKEELDKNLSLLAELYLFRFHIPDSALAGYSLLANRFPDSPYTPQALYNLGYLFSTIKHDSIRADSCFRILVRKHPDTPHARGVLKRLGIGHAISAEDSARLAFTQAENVFWSEGNPGGAADQYLKLWKQYPKSSIAPKALYSAGWMYEKALNAPEKALTVYDTLIARFPESPFASNVKAKVGAVKTAKSKPIEPDSSQARDKFRTENGPEIKKPVKTEGISDDSLKARSTVDSLKTGKSFTPAPAGKGAGADSTQNPVPPGKGRKTESLD
jgi:TolA-binding protein